MPKKQCSQCGEIKSYSEFHKGKRYVGGVESACKVCRSLNGKKRYQQKREHILAVAKAWKDAHPDQCREMVRKRRREKVEAVTTLTSGMDMHTHVITTLLKYP